MPVIVLQPRAKADISEIWEFIAEDSDDQADAFIDLIDQKADAFIDLIDQNFQLLAQKSGLGRRRKELAEGLRSFPVGRYVIFYLPIPGGVQIVRVLHGARDIEAALTKPVADE
ncbi:MAG: type II toxin-antitoxin system RelE/ParE family toxin [Cyanobium sp. 49614_E6]|nr:type II toxin-antitoxin system RelE/ParE family toxin [Cyanobium sp. 49614_E6]